LEPIVIERSWVKDNKLIDPEPIVGTAFTDEAQAHTFRIVGVDTAGDPVPLSGTVLAKILRADNWTVDVDGSIDADGAVCVTLVGDCYNIPGRTSIVIYLSDGVKTQVVYAAIFNVYRATSGRELDTGTTVPSLQQLEAAYQNAVNAAAQATAAANALPEIATVAETTAYVL
jgi:hypothetical protein